MHLPVSALRRGALLLGALLAALSLVSTPALADIELPQLPDLATVALDPTTTAYLVLDMTDTTCGQRPTCVTSLTPAGQLLQKARAAGAFVVYSTGRAPGATILPPLTPRPDDPIVRANANKFNDPNLNQVLQDHGIQTVMIVGTVANGAVLYTAFQANALGYTAVVPVDGMSANSDFDLFLTEYQLLNEPGFTNADNTPLKAGAVTLTSASQVTFLAPGTSASK